jgi:hypothetical protein
MSESHHSITASSGFCAEVNPTLWSLYCALVNRRADFEARVWTEQDVVLAMIARGLREHDFRANDTNHAASATEQPGRRYDIRRDVSTGNVVAVISVSDTHYAVVHIICD